MLQLDLSDPEVEKWALWFLKQEEKHVQGEVGNDSYLGMLQSVQNYLNSRTS